VILKRAKRIGIINLLIIFLLIFSGCSLSNGETDDAIENQNQELISRLNQRLTALGAPPLELPDSALSFLDRFGGVRILGMGEATHGSREFFEMKHRIFKYLVEHFQFRAIAFEADFAESVYINRYVTGASGDLETVMNNVMQFWSWKTSEIKTLLQWMRTYNTGKPRDQQIVYYGIDCQSTTFQPDLMQEYFSRTVPSLWNEASTIMETIRGLSDRDYQNMPEAEFHSKSSRLEALENRLEAEKSRLTAASSAREFELHKRVLKTFLQAFNFLYRVYTGNGSYTRDLNMSDNALWLANFLGNNAKITLWTHNGHTAKDPDYIGEGSMGYNLYLDQGDFYRNIGFGFSTGHFNARGENQTGQLVDVDTFEITIEPDRDSINYLWYKASRPNFVFDVEAFTGDREWNNRLSSSNAFLMIGNSYNGNPSGYYRPTDIPNHFDMIIYFNSTTATRLF
jgi:erythromycin esterase